MKIERFTASLLIKGKGYMCERCDWWFRERYNADERPCEPLKAEGEPTQAEERLLAVVDISAIHSNKGKGSSVIQLVTGKNRIDLDIIQLEVLYPGEELVRTLASRNKEVTE